MKLLNYHPLWDTWHQVHCLHNSYNDNKKFKCNRQTVWSMQIGLNFPKMSHSSWNRWRPWIAFTLYIDMDITIGFLYTIMFISVCLSTIMWISLSVRNFMCRMYDSCRVFIYVECDCLAIIICTASGIGCICLYVIFINHSS